MPEISQIDHVNIVVDDLPTMVRFYQEVLGMAVTKEVAISGAWVERVVGLNDVKADVVYLSPPQGPRVELIHYHCPDAECDNDANAANLRGLRHLAFRVDDIDAMINALASLGVDIVGEVQQVPDAQVTYAGGVRKRLIYFHDPEGNLLELCEYKTGSKVRVQ